MPADSSFPQRLAAAWPPADWSAMTVVLAISGGADSVALLRGLARLRPAEGVGRLVVAHFNHALRGAESDADERFVVELARSLELPCEVGRGAVSERAAADGDGLEAAAREARYAFLQTTAERLGARYVVTAHTADDQAETVLHRIVRGTGLSGLAGMRRARPLGPAVTLLRPLLEFRRDELRRYLDELGQPYRSDASNLDPRFTRVRLRRELLPLLAEQYNPQASEALVRLGSLAGEAQEVIDALVDTLHQRAVVSPGNAAVELDCRALADQPPYLVRELLGRVWNEQGWPLQSMGYTAWDRLAALASTPLPRDLDAQQTLPGNVTARRDGDRLRLSR